MRPAGEEPGTKKAFGEKLGRKCAKKHSEHGAKYLGIRLNVPSRGDQYECFFGFPETQMPVL